MCACPQTSHPHLGQALGAPGALGGMPVALPAALAACTWRHTHALCALTDNAHSSTPFPLESSELLSDRLEAEFLSPRVLPFPPTPSHLIHAPRDSVSFDDS